MEHIFSLSSLLKTSSTSTRSLPIIHEQHSQHFWICFSGRPPLLPPTPPESPQIGRQSCQASLLVLPPPPLLVFLLVSPDLSAGVSQPSLCLTGGLSLSRQSLGCLSAAVISSRQGHPLQHSRHTASEERPHVSGIGGGMRGISVLIKEPLLSCGH